MDQTINHLLVPVDYSEKAVLGLQMADSLLLKSGGRLTVINVFKGVDPLWSDTFTDEERNNLLQKLKKHLEDFTKKHTTQGKYEVDFLIEKGKFCETILKTSEKLNVSKIVMGTSSESNIKKRIIGSNALRIVTEADCPVVTLKNKPKDVERIILPLDITKETKEKVKFAVQIANLYNAEIKVVSAYTINDDGIIKKLQLQQNQVVDFIKERDVKCSGEMLKVGDRVDGVLEYIDENKGDLIVITTHQQLEIVEKFLGSFAQSMVSLAKIPVMSIVPKIKHKVLFKLPGT